MALVPGSLKCVVAPSWGDAIEPALRSLAGRDDVLRLGDDTFLVYTDAGTAAIRDRLAPYAPNGEALLVLEFERWSGGGDIDHAWLTRRGH